MAQDFDRAVIESVGEYPPVEESVEPAGPRFGIEAAAAGDRSVGAILETLDPISLEATNASSGMLKRSESKYVMTDAQLRKVLIELRDRFAVLTIDRRRIFDYRSCYFDDALRLFHDHQQRRRLRVKVRTREYLDTGDIFFEIKLKERRGATNKKRQPSAVFGPTQIDGENLAMLRRYYKELYDKEFTLTLRPSLIVEYRRFTLVSKAGGERATIDSYVRFRAPGGPVVQVGDDFVIVETKSGGRSIADRVIRDEHIRKASMCSKYCIGVVLTGLSTKYNNFRPMVRRVRDKIVR